MLELPPMELVIWIGLIGGTLFMIWYGYGLLVRRPAERDETATDEMARCHLCRRERPVREMVTREKAAGFENHFCGDCIEQLHRDYMGRGAARTGAGALPGRN